MPARGIHHVDLAVTDVERSLAFYLGLLGPLGWVEEVRYPTYRGTEEVVYLREPASMTRLGLRPADAVVAMGAAHERCLAFEVDSREEVDAAHERCLADGAEIHHPPEPDNDIDGYYAFFVFDPDGMRTEVFAWPQARDPGWSP
jgi:glyoxylase I family protein